MKKLLIFVVALCLIGVILIVTDVLTIKILKTIGLFGVILIGGFICGGIQVAGGYFFACFSLLLFFLLGVAVIFAFRGVRLAARKIFWTIRNIFCLLAGKPSI